MMPIGYYNYVIGGRLNTRETREREKKGRGQKNLYSLYIFPIKTMACWDDEKTARQSLL